MYNRTTFQSFIYSVADQEVTKSNIILTLEDGHKLTFNRKDWCPFILT